MKNLDEVINDIKTLPTVPIWPHLGLVLGLSRGGCYDLVRSGKVETIDVGKAQKKVVSAWLRAKLQLGAA
jgi:hypothetical protein